MLARDGTPYLLEANRASHMLGEYRHYYGDDRPFELTAAAMNEGCGPPCLLWRKGDPLPDAEEDACYIGNLLSPYLRESPRIAFVEENTQEQDLLVTRTGETVVPGSIFRWWYGLPSSYEQQGVRVINPNSVWAVVRDKLACYDLLRTATHFRVPRSFPVGDLADVERYLQTEKELFQRGSVLKPRVGWGGQGVQILGPQDSPAPCGRNYLLSERILPALRKGEFWDVRVFVMAGVYLGAIIHSSPSPNTNYWQGGRPAGIDPGISRLLEPAALEAVRRLDAAADAVHRGEKTADVNLLRVEYKPSPHDL